MSRFRGFLLAALSRLLESDSRDVVIGDLAELNLGSLRATWEMCGLILMLIPSVFFFLPAVWGARRANSGGLSSHQAIILLAATVGLIALVTWTSG
jgi:hypothetical protein